MPQVNITCIDDSKAVHIFLKSCLEKSTASFHSFFDADEAIKAIKSGQWPKSDIIFLDWEMPIMTGPEYLVEFSKLQIKTPVVMLTTKNSAEDIQKAIELGASEYIMKPFTPDILKEKLSMLGIDIAI